MKTKQTESEEQSPGGLGSEEIESLFERGYDLSSKRYIAEAWGLKPDAVPTEVATRINDTEHISTRLQDIGKLKRATLSQVSANGGRMRGENLRRDLLLRGFGDTEKVLRELVESCILIPLPNPGESELDIESLLEQDNFLQRDLAVPHPVYKELESEADQLGPEALDSWKGDVSTEAAGDIGTLELNLLHLTSLLVEEPLQLNKSGAPNRRSLTKFAEGVTFPGQVGEAGAQLDLNDAVQFDYVSFLLSLAAEMGFITQTGHTLVGKPEKLEAFFCADQEDRNRELVNGFQGIKYWDEVESLALSRGESRVSSDEHFSQFEPTGESFIGARGYVMSVLRRSRIGDWMPVAAILDLCAQLDRHYLPRALSNADPPVKPRQYIEAVLRRGLVWTGIVEFGESEDEVELMRFTRRGADIMNLSTDRPDAEAPSSTECLVVQPNFEVMLFLDPAPLHVVYRLYQVGERTKLADRVANFQLTAESVQRGFGLGLDADKVVELLQDYSQAPLPDTVQFQLQDWERVHGKLHLYANGILLRHPNPDRLDMIVGQLEHDRRRQEDFDIIRLEPTSVFLAAEYPPGLDRIVEQEDGLDINYLGDIPPTLYFVGPLELMVDPIECDLVTLSEIQNLTSSDSDDGEDRTQFLSLKTEKIKARWPDNPLENVLEFLSERTVGGIPPSQALKLRSQLEKPLQVSISRNVTVIVLESVEIADKFEKIPECETLIDARLGDRSFTIQAEHEEELSEVLEELGTELTEQ